MKCEHARQLFWANICQTSDIFALTFLILNFSGGAFDCSSAARKTEQHLRLYLIYYHRTCYSTFAVN